MVIVVSAEHSLESDLGHNPEGIGKTKCIFQLRVLIALKTLHAFAHLFMYPDTLMHYWGCINHCLR